MFPLLSHDDNHELKSMINKFGIYVTFALLNDLTLKVLILGQAGSYKCLVFHNRRLVSLCVMHKNSVKVKVCLCVQRLFALES